jgi:ArsR family transcriptional regulator, lead/cadmium/zinc/bismuth-responsive transcriptional repressor
MMEQVDQPTAENVPLGNEMSQRLADLFEALADPTRVRIISMLVAGERSVGDLVARLEMSISAISHQLNLLRHLHIVVSRRDGRRIIYRLDDEHVALIYQYGVDHILHQRI